MVAVVVIPSLNRQFVHDYSTNTIRRLRNEYQQTYTTAAEARDNDDYTVVFPDEKTMLKKELVIKMVERIFESFNNCKKASSVNASTSTYCLIFTGFDVVQLYCREQVLREKGIDPKAIEKKWEARTRRLPRINKAQEEEYNVIEQQLKHAQEARDREDATPDEKAAAEAEFNKISAEKEKILEDRKKEEKEFAQKHRAQLKEQQAIAKTLRRVGQDPSNRTLKDFEAHLEDLSKCTVSHSLDNNQLRRLVWHDLQSDMSSLRIVKLWVHAWNKQARH